MSTYEEFMVILTFALLVVAILDFDTPTAKAVGFLFQPLLLG